MTATPSRQFSERSARSASARAAHEGDPARRLQALVELGQQLRADLSPGPLLALTCREIMGAIGAGEAAIGFSLRLDGSIGVVIGVAPESPSAAAWQAQLETDAETRRALVEHAHPLEGPLVLPDALRDLLFGGSGRPLDVVETATALPLVSRGAHLGGLVVLERHSGRVSADRPFLSAMADVTATALANARLFAQSRREIRRREALRRVVEHISSELDLDTLLSRVVTSAVELFNARGGLISLVESDGTMRVRAVEPEPRLIVGSSVQPGVGLSGLVLERRAPVVVSDVTRDVPGGVGLPIAEGPALAVPIWWKNSLQGVFGVFSPQEPGRRFNSQDVGTMELLANHVAIALNNARLYAEIQTRLEEIVGIQRLGTVMLQEHDFDRVLQAVCEQLQDLTEAGGVGLALLDDNPNFLELRTVVGPSAEALRGARVPLEGSFAGVALRTDQPQISNDALNDPRGYRQSLQLGNTRTILSVPMKTRQRAVGVLSIYNKRGGVGFTQRDAELATLFANQAAVAIENARLYEQAREYAVVEERNRLARELHDSVTQSLFSVTLLCQAALSLWDRDRDTARERLERASELAQGALAEMRALIFQIRPITLREEGLISALNKHLAAVRSRDGLNVTLKVDGEERRLPFPVEEAAFRIVQESLNNVVKHAHASTATVEVHLAGDELRVCTADDGVGFQGGAGPGVRTLGLASMRERAEEVGGSLTIESAPGRGARVCAVLPVASSEQTNDDARELSSSR